MLVRLLLTIFLSIYSINVSALENCKWDNRKGVPCLTVSKTPNTSIFNEKNINKKVINKQDIVDSGAIDTNDVFKFISVTRYSS